MKVSIPVCQFYLIPQFYLVPNRIDALLFTANNGSVFYHNDRDNEWRFLTLEFPEGYDEYKITYEEAIKYLMAQELMR